MVLADVRPNAVAPAPRDRGAPEARRPRVSRTRRTQVLLVQALLMSALASLHVVIGDISWWLLGSVAAAAMLTTTTWVRSRARRAGWPSIVGFGVGIALLTGLYAPGTAILGLIPTFDTVGALAGVLRSGMQSIAEQSAPASPTPGIVMLLVIVMLTSAWFSDVFLAASTPALVALPVGAILLVPVAVRPGLADPLWFIVTAVLYLALLRVGRRADSRRIVGLLGIVAIGGALVAPAVMPDVRDPRGGGGIDGYRTGVNPLVSLGDDLRRGAPMSLLSYTTDATGPVYLRLATMESFFGNVWEPTATRGLGGGDLSAIGPPPGLAADVAADPATVVVEVGSYTSRWIPAPYPAVSVTGFDGDAEWLRDTLAMRSTDSSISAQTYSVDFLEVDPTGEQLVRGGSLDVSEQTLELPELPANIVATANEVAGAARTPFEKAVALQSYLRGSPFRYSEETPVEQDFDGTSVEAISAFLEVKAGYCVHYASAMAVMARELGIPSRLAVGFQPGAAQTVDGETVHTLTTDDLHAWPELFIEGVGWMRFEPTPGRGSVPAFESTPVDDPATPEDESVVEATAAPAPTSTPGARPLDDDTAEDPAAVVESSSSAVAWIVAVALAVLVAVPSLFRVAVRAGRVRRIRRGEAAADAAWSELRDTARDHGWSAPESETPRVFVERLVEAIDDSDGVLREFRASVESSAFAQHPAPLTVDALRDARRVIAESTPLRGRVAALLLPASLVYRWKPDD
ncbi:DUF3488 and transglutaminase-like domain-containing protein [Salinibacterium sp. ZJ70]|uniref:transglutaminase family protein n=1 Tax=Salinibacterium sp. ZJ70 TaxID=2708084 RepID=UPI001422A89A|nr:DUF3488 and transglutaminase-like domain-containing protein [Salinibacterium sp. ZJ70]